MRTREQLEREREARQRELDELDRRIAARDGYGDDPFKNGDIIKVIMTYPPTDAKAYTYAVVKAAGLFYLTGRVQRTSLNAELSEIDGRRTGWKWDQFVAWLAAGDASVWRASKLERIL